MNEKLQNLLELVRRTAWQAGDLAADAVYGAGQMADDLLSSAKCGMAVYGNKKH